MKIDKEKTISNLHECFGIEEQENYFTSDLTYKNSKFERILKITKTDFKDNIKLLKELSFKDIILYKYKYFEQLLYLRSTRNLINPSEKINPADVDSNIILIEDSNNGLIYELSRPSIEFILASFSKLDISNMNNLPSLFYADYLKISPGKQDLDFLKDRIKRVLRGKTLPRSLYFDKGYIVEFENLLRIHSNAFTLKINSDKNINPDIFDKLSSSFLFLIGYHRNVPIMEFRNIKPNVKHIKDFRTHELNFPKQIYNKKLIYYYQQALSTDNPVLKYLSYYQILEHFFDIVANENLINEVTDTINHPDFSTKQNKSIEDLIELIRASHRNEKLDLQLVLKKYLKIENLKKDLLEYDTSYYTYIITNKVDFADAQNINVKGKNEDIDIKSVSERITKVRNALIHTKHGKDDIYIPFTDHEEELLKELPFIRLIAEQIIINSSEEITI
ncbi:MAG: hypothetical protein GYA51_17975 [Candidatus Methanofastidiosa archaeon]|nr:hypothetical protein [Candidatus Methanofastidiosa archaeon]